MNKFRVRFFPDDKVVEVAQDTTILQAALTAGIYINSSCGGDGVCGKCKVFLKSGKVITQPNSSLSSQEKEKHAYLACITTVHSDIEVDIPRQSKIELGPEVKGIYSEAEDVQVASPKVAPDIFRRLPLVTKLYLELEPPSPDDNTPDAERLVRKIRKLQDAPVIQTGISNIRQLAELLRDSDWKVTVTLGVRDNAVEIVLVEPLDTSADNFGLAFDIGTTTITGQLVDLNSGKTMGTKAAYNRQASFGADVITRIIHAQKERGLEELHNAVCETINELIRELVSHAGLNLTRLGCIVCAGNTTMIHLLLNIDPSFIRREPYVPTVNALPVMRASEASLKINPRGLLYCLPGVSSYVGADISAGVLSSGLYKEDELCLLIDIGTNGEIVLGNKDFMVACAASAGPAFEGSGVSCGMRAAGGAIEKVTISKDALKVTYETLGNRKPRGICGSGYISLISAMFYSQVIDKAGRIIPIDSPRIRQAESGREFVVAFRKEADSAGDIVISEADIDNLKRSKAAIFSASAALARHVSLDFPKIKKVFIAGGFGTSLEIESAVSIGLLPDLERERFIFIGNSSLAGSRSVLFSHDAMKKVEEIASRITYFELSSSPGYMDEYMAALFFPHTDLDKFPSVGKKLKD